ncbi:hypothetical protein BKA93DRAFT_825558 [Sparassis latifolia]
MIRTQRASSPRAVIRDYAVAKNGMDKHIPKGGAGPHNWGSLGDEWELEQATNVDEQVDAEDAGFGSVVNDIKGRDAGGVTNGYGEVFELGVDNCAHL